MSAAAPAPRRLRSVLPPAVGVIVASFWTWRTGGATWSIVLLAATAVLLLLALFAPRAFAPVQRVLDAFTRVVLRVVTYVLLALVFALVFVPGRLVLRLAGRDILRRQKAGPGESYWQPVKTVEGGDFSRQF